MGAIPTLTINVYDGELEKKAYTKYKRMSRSRYNMYGETNSLPKVCTRSRGVMEFSQWSVTERLSQRGLFGSIRIWSSDLWSAFDWLRFSRLRLIGFNPSHQRHLTFHYIIFILFLCRATFAGPISNGFR